MELFIEKQKDFYFAPTCSDGRKSDIKREVLV